MTHTYTESQPPMVEENWQRRSESVGYIRANLKATGMYGGTSFIQY